MERQYTPILVGIEYECDECHKGMMEATGGTQAEIVGGKKKSKYQHKCTACGEEEWLENKYPRIIWKKLPDIVDGCDPGFGRPIGPCVHD